MSTIAEAAAPPAQADLTPQLKTAVQFLTALFDPDDHVIFRPIETWEQGGRKQSRVAFQSIRYPRARQQELCAVLRSLLRCSEKDFTNIFFGVCPRFGVGGRYDLGWQIRAVRALWADVDHATVDESLARVKNAGLPDPSIVVDSGNGAHLYWLLEEPYRIDDVADPSPVELEWPPPEAKSRKPRQYVQDGAERIYLDKNKHAFPLSPKARHLEDVVAGVAAAIGGDHTHDTARLLRVPGTWNRKNQRNGAEPKRTLLIACNRRLRYPLARFEPLAETSPTAEKRRQIAAIPLPQPRKLTGAKQDQLEDRIASCVIAPVGLRSPADFALCCFAVRSGVAREEVWRRVSGIGKFAERGEAYFNTTWDSAENAVRTEKVTHLQRSIERQAAPCVDDDDEDYDFGGGGLPSSAGEPDQPRRPTITICPSTLVFTTMQAITGRLLATQSCYSRADQLVVTREASIRPILGAAELAGLLNQYVEFYFADDEGGEYKPLPPAFGNTWLNQADERARLPRIALYSHNPVYTEDWRLVAPGYDAQSEIYYAGPEIEVRPDTEHLDRLLREFCFQTPGDRTNYIGMLLTALLVPRFIGAKPAVLLSGNQAGLGKSVLAQIVAILRDGHPVETASYNPNDEEFEKRLGSIVHRGVTTLVIDNAKSSGRNPRIESACLERSITDPILSFRLLGHSRDIRVENSHLFCLTANTPEISRDLVTRSVVVNLYHEGDPARRTFDMADPEEYAQTHRLELWGELVGMVERWKAAGSPLAQTHNRFNKRGWGDIVGGILEACGEPDFLANAELAALELDDTRQQFAELVTLLARHEQGVWTAAELACLAAGQQLLVDELGDGTPRSKATRMGKIAGRYVNDPFELSDDAQAFLRRSGDRKGTTYRLEVSTPPHGAERGDVCRTSAERVISNVRHT